MISVRGRAPITTGIRCMDGVGKGACEDLVPRYCREFKFLDHPSVKQDGWQILKGAYRTMDHTPREQRMVDWYEQLACDGKAEDLSNGGEHVWDMDCVNKKLQIMEQTPPPAWTVSWLKP